MRLSGGELSALQTNPAREGRPAFDAVLEEARASPVVQIDEPDRRENGRTGWVWTLTTETARLFHCSRSQAGAATDRRLGEAGAGAAELFTFVADPAASPANNAAERAPRPLVTARKVSGGNPPGTGQHEAHGAAVPGGHPGVARPGSPHRTPVARSRQPMIIAAGNLQPRRPVREVHLGLDDGHAQALVRQPAGACPIAQPGLRGPALGQFPRRVRFFSQQRTEH